MTSTQIMDSLLPVRGLQRMAIVHKYTFHRETNTDTMTAAIMIVDNLQYALCKDDQSRILIHVFLRVMFPKSENFRRPQNHPFVLWHPCLTGEMPCPTLNKAFLGHHDRREMRCQWLDHLVLRFIMIVGPIVAIPEGSMKIMIIITDVLDWCRASIYSSTNPFVVFIHIPIL